MADQRRANAWVLRTAIIVSVLGFFGLDALYTTVAVGPAGRGPAGRCEVPHPLRHHALKADCRGSQHWGRATFPVITNSLGFRDEAPRRVGKAADRPRLLLLGDSFVRGPSAWPDTVAGMLAERLPEIEVLNGGVDSYSPSNYLNLTREVLAAGYEIDETMVFLDISDIQDEAAYYRDAEGGWAVHGPALTDERTSFYARTRQVIRRRLLLTDTVFEWVEHALVAFGVYHLNLPPYGNLFSMPRSAWTYSDPPDGLVFPSGYAPLGAAGGIKKAKAKLAGLYRLLKGRRIPLSVAVYPWPEQIVHDDAESRQVSVWRQWCRDKCKRFVSAFQPLLAEKKRCTALLPGCWYARNFIFGDVHFNRAGNRLVVDTVIEALRRAPVVKRPD